MTKFNLSPHFTINEFERSATATAKKIDNTVPRELIPSLTNLCIKVLEPLRSVVNQPIIVSSGYRCLALNKAVSGVATSQHMKGEAADIVAPNKATLLEWYKILQQQGNYDQLILEHTAGKSNYWIHVSCRLDASQNRKKAFELTA